MWTPITDLTDPDLIRHASARQPVALIGPNIVTLLRWPGPRVARRGRRARIQSTHGTPYTVACSAVTHAWCDTTTTPNTPPPVP